jgi:hypothetical protein
MTTMKISTDPPGATYSGAGSEARVGNACDVCIPARPAAETARSHAAIIPGPGEVWAWLWRHGQPDREAAG